MLLDSGKELGLLLLNLCLPSSVHRIEHSASNSRPKQPTQPRSRHRHQPECQERIQRNLSYKGLGDARSEHHGTQGTAEEAIGDGEGELIATTLEAEGEERVPIEGGIASDGGIGSARRRRRLLRVCARKRLRYQGQRALLTQRRRRRPRKAKGSHGGRREGSFRDKAGGGGLARVAHDERLERRCHC